MSYVKKRGLNPDKLSFLEVKDAKITFFHNEYTFFADYEVWNKIFLRNIAQIMFLKSVSERWKCKLLFKTKRTFLAQLVDF